MMLNKITNDVVRHARVYNGHGNIYRTGYFIIHSPLLLRETLLLTLYMNAYTGYKGNVITRI